MSTFRTTGMFTKFITPQRPVRQLVTMFPRRMWHFRVEISEHAQCLRMGDGDEDNKFFALQHVANKGLRPRCFRPAHFFDDWHAICYPLILEVQFSGRKEHD